PADMDNHHTLHGKTVVITGSSSGVGRAAALCFAKRGACVVLSARNEKALKEAAREARSAGGHTLTVVTDVTDPAAVARLAATADKWRGGIDVWINNAGVLAAGEFDKTPVEVHEQVVTTNLLGYIHGAHAVLPYFKRRKKGILINNISIGGFMPVPFGAAYSASKFGLRGLSEALRGELWEWPDIHVCDLYSGFMRTPGIDHAANYTGKELRLAPPVYDPVTIAGEMVALALDPKPAAYPGRVPLLFKAAHALFPEFATKAAGMIMEAYFRKAGTARKASGNLFHSVDDKMQSRRRGRPGRRATGKFITIGIIGGLAVGSVAAGIMLSRAARTAGG
ncbi:MAG TPA: SDR family oxidoreductase, partial [Puia sp.]|nr:SDR family oxidoreductase [Puia sp.]